MSGIQSEIGLFEAAIESARIFDNVVAECAMTGGLLAAIPEFSSASEIMNRMNFHPAKSEPLQAFLKVLVDLGLVEHHQGDTQAVYRVNSKTLKTQKALGGGLKEYLPKYEVLDPWFGQSHVRHIRSANHALLGQDLSFFRSPSANIRFDRSYLNAWQTNLTNPLYEFGRMVAVREIINRGSRFLDLASGLGYGARRLAEYSRQDCQIVCVDKSADMIAESERLIYPGAQVQWIRWDLNNGLPLLPMASFDGVLFNGAFHFIKDKGSLLRDIHRVMRPGGLLVLGHCYCHSGFIDESMHELYFSLLLDKNWPIRFEDLRTMVADAGFLEFRQYHRGSHSYLLADRSANNYPSCH